jgi:hypothetical protein
MEDHIFSNKSCSMMKHTFTWIVKWTVRPTATGVTGTLTGQKSCRFKALEVIVWFGLCGLTNYWVSISRQDSKCWQIPGHGPRNCYSVLNEECNFPAYFQQHEAPGHYSAKSSRLFRYPVSRHWLASWSPPEWPTWSPHLTPLNFYWVTHCHKHFKLHSDEIKF